MLHGMLAIPSPSGREDDLARHLGKVMNETGFAARRDEVDAKGPLAAMICAAVARPSFPGTIRVIGAVEEKRLSRGGHHVARPSPRPTRS